MDERFLGDVQLTVSGEVTTSDEDFNFPIDVRVSVFWNPQLEGASRIEQAAASTEVQQPSSFTLRLFETPRTHERLHGGDDGGGDV
ncbi:MAG: hypothetical protein AAF658_05790, partial [Myxococcota bacterium]